MKVFAMLLVFASSLFAQELDLTKVTKTTKKYLENNADLTIQRASCHSLNDCESFDTKKRHLENNDFKLHKKEYILDISKEDFIETLVSAHPKNIWAGKSLFQLSYNHNNGNIIYNDQSHPGLEVGELIILELTVTLGDVIKARMPVAFEIVELDKERGVLAFSYVRTNKSKGIQHLIVKSTEDGKARIIHTTRFRSGEEFRDNKLYATFHEQLMDDFYTRIEKFIQKR